MSNFLLSFFCYLFCDLFSSSTTTSTRSLCRRNFCDLFAIFLRSFFLRSCPLTANWLPQPARTTARLRRLSGKPTELSGEIPVRTAPRRSRAPAPQEANSRLLGCAAHPQLTGSRNHQTHSTAARISRQTDRTIRRDTCTNRSSPLASTRAAGSQQSPSVASWVRRAPTANWLPQPPEPQHGCDD